MSHSAFELLSVCAVALVLTIAVAGAASGDATQAKDATAETKRINSALLKQLPFDNREDFEDVQRGFIAPLPDGGVIRGKDGQVCWDLTRFSFIKPDAPAPDTVNPSLWRQARLLLYAGLFKVTDRIYQVRSADLSNITFLEGKDGIIVVDPLITAETARASLELYYHHRPKKPVAAVIYTHSHVDHFGGVKGVTSEEDVKAGKVKIVAPDGFLKAALDENVMAGNAMTRRASYMYGNVVPPGPKGMVGSGLGITTSAGNVTLIPPTDIIVKTGQELTLAGLKFEFQVVPDTEAPAEMHFFLPELKTLCTAENCTHTLHNLYTLRGAKIRDALAWSKYLNEALQRWGDKSEILLSVHHWPVWGNKKVIDRIKSQRDMYRYIHDQALRLANHGYTMTEIAEILELPEPLAKEWYNRGYYGSLNHDVKSVYVKYLGWFDGNPANLHPLPPVEAAKRYVEFMGGADAVIEKARKYYDKGEYRWVAQVVNHVVFADPKNKGARELQADTLEQLGYQAESGPWRNFYLSGAQELRKGLAKTALATTASPDSIQAMPLDLFFDYLGIRLNGPKAAKAKMTLNWNFTDTKELYLVTLENGALNHTPNAQAEHADVTITLTRNALNEVILRQATLQAKVASGEIKVDGDKTKVPELLSYMDTFDFWFNIVTP